MEKDGFWILTLLVRVGPVENDISIKLTDEGIDLIKPDRSYIEKILLNIRDCRDLYSDRELRPPVWP